MLWTDYFKQNKILVDKTHYINSVSIRRTMHWNIDLKCRYNWVNESLFTSTKLINSLLISTITIIIILEANKINNKF